MKTNNEYIKELQDLADKHEDLKKEIEYFVKEADAIEDKLLHSDRLFSLTESINKTFVELDEIEIKYNELLKEYKNK